MKNTFDHPLPDAKGYFGEFGGSFVPAELQIIIDEITEAYHAIRQDPVFLAELTRLYQHFVGRPSPIFHAQSLSERLSISSAKISTTPELTRSTTAWVRRCWPRRWARRR